MSQGQTKRELKNNHDIIECPFCGAEVNNQHLYSHLPCDQSPTSGGSSVSANYSCPACGNRLVDGAGVNVYECRTCGETVVEAVAEKYQQVRQFYDRATARAWGGLR